MYFDGQFVGPDCDVFAPSAASLLTSLSGKQHTSRVIRTAQFAFRFEATLITVLQRRLSWVAPSRQYPAHFAAIQVNLISDLYADENGKAAHEECYVKRIAGSNSRAAMGDD
jgi:hypothetical protein